MDEREELLKETESGLSGKFSGVRVRGFPFRLAIEVEISWVNSLGFSGVGRGRGFAAAEPRLREDRRPWAPRAGL
jgi:hypothetical protein